MKRIVMAWVMSPNAFSKRLNGVMPVLRVVAENSHAVRIEKITNTVHIDSAGGIFPAGGARTQPGRIRQRQQCRNHGE